jgi:predicted nucleotidyltransferase
LALFGLALRDDFFADSDLDILVDFDKDADWGLLEHIQMS